MYLRGKVWWIAYSVRGKQFAESAKSSNKRDAEKLLRLRLKKVSSGRRFVNPAKEEQYTIEDLKKQLVESYQRKQNRSVKKMLCCMAHVEKAFQFLRLVDIDTERVREYSAARLNEGAARGTVNQELRLLKAGFNLMFRAKMISDMPAFELLQGETVRKGFIEYADFCALLAEIADDDTRDLIEFLYRSGWRSNEGKQFRWAWINFDEKLVTLPEEHSKSKEQRTLPLVGGLLDVIERRMGKRQLTCPHVFHRRGRAIKDFCKAFVSAATAIGQPNLRPHDMRRSAVRNFRRAGLSEKEGMLLSGHSTRAVFDRYSIVSPGDQIANMRRVDAHLKKQAGRKVVPIKKETA